jgi:competence protein ComK
VGAPYQIHPSKRYPVKPIKGVGVLFIKNEYLINPQFMFMAGIYDRNAKLCTLVTELTSTFIVDKAPLEILNDSIRCIGFDLRGAMETARFLLGNKNMCPVMVNPVHKICVFPDKCSKHNDTKWFNPIHITKTNSMNKQTNVEFTNGMTITVPIKLYYFNNRLQTAEQFRNMTVVLENNPCSHGKDPRKGA